MGEKISELITELVPHALYELKVFGIDMSITKAVIVLWLAVLLVFLLVWVPSRRPKLVPSGWQNVVESLIEFVRDGLVLDIMGEQGKPYFPVIATLFLFIFVANLLGIVPGSFAPTSLSGTTAAWAVIVFILYNAVGIAKHGAFGYLKTFVPPGTPWWLMPVMLLLEIVSHIARPISLAIRLFANILSGHMVLGVFTVLALTSAFYIKALPFSMIVIMYLFEILVAGLQAYIFSILAAIYIGLALQEEH